MGLILNRNGGASAVREPEPVKPLTLADIRRMNFARARAAKAVKRAARLKESLDVEEINNSG